MTKVYAKIKSGKPEDYIEGEVFEVLEEGSLYFCCDLVGDGRKDHCLWEGCPHLNEGSWERIEEED